MKTIQKREAISLREQGKSIKEIAREIGVAKSSVSLWVRNIELTERQKDYLEKKGLFREKIERARTTRLTNEKIKRDVVINEAKDRVPKINDQQLWLMGIALYWGEGGKTQRTVRFANSDPDLIKMMMLFFRKICGVPETKFRGHIHIHQHLDHKLAESYWSDISGIPKTKLYKTYRKQNKSSLNKKDSLPYGTFDIYVMDTQLFYKIVGWSRGITSRLWGESMGSFRADRGL